MKQLKYLIIDMHSFINVLQFKKNEQIEYFFNLINEQNDNRDIMLFFTDNESEYRKYLLKESFNEYDYIFNKNYKTDNIINIFLEYIKNNNIQNVKLIKFNNYEPKDVIFTAIKEMSDYCINNKREIDIKLLSTSQIFILSILLFKNKNNYFKFDFLRYCRSKKYTGFEEIQNVNKYIYHYFSLKENNVNQKFNEYNKTQNALNDFYALSNYYSSHFNPNLKLFNKIGEKKASNIINTYISLNHMFSGYDLIKEKLNIEKENIEKAKLLSEIMNINLNIDKNYIFSTIKNHLK